MSARDSVVVIGVPGFIIPCNFLDWVNTFPCNDIVFVKEYDLTQIYS